MSIATETSTTEQWAHIDGINLYSISDKGRILHAITKREVATHMDKSGYPRVTLRIAGKQTHMLLHRVVAMAYLPDFEYGVRVGFRNGDRTDCRADNLYMTGISCRAPKLVI